VPKKKWIYFAVSTAVSLVLLLILLAQIRIRDLVQALENIYRPALGAYVAIALGTVWLRALRYRRLLRPEPISWKNVLLVTFVRNGFEDLLPARLGSLSYVYVLDRILGYSLETAASTFVVAMALDLMTLGPFLILAIGFVGFGTAEISGPLLFAGAVGYFGLMALLLWKIVPVMNVCLKIYQRALRAFRVDRDLPARRSVDKFKLIIRSLEQIRNRRTYPALFGLSLAIRLGKYLALYALLFAILRNSGFALTWLNFWKTILGISGAELTAFMPLKGIADVGTWASAWTIAFTLMKFDLKLAVISGLGVHAITNLFEYTLALAALATLAILKKAGRLRRPAPPPAV